MKFINRKGFVRIIFYVLLGLLIPVAVVGIWVAQPVLGSNPDSIFQVAPDKLEAHVKKLSVDFVPRDYLHTNNLDRCAEYIQEHFEAAGAETSIQEYFTGSEGFKNVIGRFGPESGPRIVIGAHYDAFRWFPASIFRTIATIGSLDIRL